MTDTRGVTTDPGTDWRTRAACLAVDPETMFPDRSDLEGVETAKRICRRCDVRAECADLAETLDLRYGVFGGQDEEERAAGHGTISLYRKGCRCRRCVSAKTNYTRLRREAARAS